MWILKKVYYFFVDTIQSILIAASFFLIIYMFIARPFQVNGESMYPNFQDGEYVLTNLITLRFAPLKVGDVVVFRAPPDPEKDFIKRIIAMTGDTVMIKEGEVYVNGRKVDETLYLKSDIKTYSGSFLKEGETVTVPEESYFVMGDNRPYSSDSREWGFVKKSAMIGKSFFIYWPIPEAAFVQNPYK